MISFLFVFVPTFSVALLGLTIWFQVFKKSVSTFISILSLAIASNLIYYGLPSDGLAIIILSSTIMLLLAIAKPDVEDYYFNLVCKKYDSFLCNLIKKARNGKV